MSEAIATQAEAPLPVRYESARTAIAAAASLDECAEWTSKAAALASYARQSKDDSLLAAATRIKARAVRRTGELLREIPASPGGDRKSDRAPLPSLKSPRQQAATNAGLSTDQARRAVRVARVPAIEFEKSVEADKPPSLMELEARGTQKKQPVTSCTADTCTPTEKDKLRAFLLLIYGFDSIKNYNPAALIGACSKKGLRDRKLQSRVKDAIRFLSEVNGSISRRLL